MAALRDRLEAGLKAIAPEAVIFGAGGRRLPNTTLFAVPGMKAETAVIAFDLEGVAVSSGSACSSGKVAPSHVLAAMGVPPDLARGAIRVSLGHATTEAEIDAFLKAWEKLAESLYKAGKQQASPPERREVANRERTDHNRQIQPPALETVSGGDECRPYKRPSIRSAASTSTNTSTGS